MCQSLPGLPLPFTVGFSVCVFISRTTGLRGRRSHLPTQERQVRRWMSKWTYMGKVTRRNRPQLNVVE